MNFFNTRKQRPSSVGPHYLRWKQFEESTKMQPGCEVRLRYTGMILVPRMYYARGKERAGGRGGEQILHPFPYFYQKTRSECRACVRAITHIHPSPPSIPLFPPPPSLCCEERSTRPAASDLSPGIKITRQGLATPPAATAVATNAALTTTTTTTTITASPRLFMPSLLLLLLLLTTPSPTAADGSSAYSLAAARALSSNSFLSTLCSS